MEGNSLLALGSRFSIIGILATVTYFIIANALILTTSLSPVWASVIAYVAGMLVSFSGQGRFTFRVKDRTSSHIIRYIVLSIVGVAISYWSVEYVVGTLGIAAFWGTLITALAIPLLSFLAMKFWVFD